MGPPWNKSRSGGSIRAAVTRRYVPHGIAVCGVAKLSIHLMLTRILVAALAVLTAAGLWRLARWYWRPRLSLPAAPVLGREAGGVRLAIVVRNDGAAKSRGCRARLIRAERREGGEWVRVDATRAARQRNSRLPRKGIRSHGAATLEVDRLLPAEPGRYRVEVAVINGEEKRS